MNSTPLLCIYHLPQGCCASNVIVPIKQSGGVSVTQQVVGSGPVDAHESLRRLKAAVLIQERHYNTKVTLCTRRRLSESKIT